MYTFLRYESIKYIFLRMGAKIIKQHYEVQYDDDVVEYMHNVYRNLYLSAWLIVNINAWLN